MFGLYCMKIGWHRDDVSLQEIMKGNALNPDEKIKELELKLKQEKWKLFCAGERKLSEKYIQLKAELDDLLTEGQRNAQGTGAANGGLFASKAASSESSCSSLEAPRHHPIS